MTSQKKTAAGKTGSSWTMKFSLSIFETIIELVFETLRFKCRFGFSKENFQPVLILMYNFADFNLINQRIMFIKRGYLQNHV